jgi:hypothetical protein
MKNQTLTFSLIAMLALSACKPEEIVPNDGTASGNTNGTAIMRGTIYANANETDDEITVYSDPSTNGTEKLRVQKVGDFKYYYRYFDYENATSTFNYGECGWQTPYNKYFSTPVIFGTFALDGQSYTPVSGLPNYCSESNVIVGGSRTDTIVYSGQSTSQVFDIFYFMREFGAPVSGITISAQFNTIDLASVASNDYQYPTQVVSTTTDANGNYALAIPANAANVAVTITVGDKVMDYTPYTNYPSGSTEEIGTRPFVFSAKKFINDAGVSADPYGKIERVVKQGDVIYQNFIMTPQ